MIPHTLKIRGHTYTIKQVDQRALGEDFMADVDNSANIIRLYKRATPSRKIELILHEVIHAMLSGYEISAEEHLVVTLGEAFTEFIRSNPNFIKHALKTL